MTSLTSTETFITKVDADRTIHLPESVLDGATVAVIAMPPNWQDEEVRQARFAAALDEIESLVREPSVPNAMSDHDLNKLVRKLRKEVAVF